MRRNMLVATALTMVLTLTACASNSKDTAKTEDVESGETTTIANPWTSVETAQEAAEGAGMGYFEVPADGTQSSIGPINWYGYQYMEYLAEADGAVGAAELTVRKGINAERAPEDVSYDGNDVSGDYTEYAYTWEMDVDDWKVTCFGNEDGKTMKAIWKSDNFSYSIMVRGQGDLYDTFGLGSDDTAAIVKAVQ